jgi:DNA-binding ferritin-like protein
MPSSPSHDPISALNEVLSEVIDAVQDVKQAHRKVAETHALHAELDQLLDDLKEWAGMLMQDDETLGVSPLAFMPSVAGRKPANLWSGVPSDEAVRRTVEQHLDRLLEHIAAALAEHQDDASRATLAKVQRELLAHRRRLNEV